MRTETVPLKMAWEGNPPPGNIVNTFTAGYVPSRIFGPGRLLRLLSGGGTAVEGQIYNPSNVYGLYWITEQDFIMLKNQVAKGLKTQGTVDQVTFTNRMRFALRDKLRGKMAICRDWTPSFDFIALLNIPAGKSVTGLVGTTKGQNPYGADFPGAGKAIAPDTLFAGGITQYVIRFDVAANKEASSWDTTRSFNSLI